MAAVKPGTGEVLSFGLNRYYDATPAAANDPTKTSQNYAVDLADGGGSGWTIGSSWKPINLIAWMEAGHSINDNLQTSTSYPTTDFACSNYSGGADSWNVSNAMGAGTVNPESPFLGLVRSHNTTQASMGAILKLCKVADTATELGYHDAATGETIDKTQVYTPSMMIGSVNVSPLTMASIFAVYASNGVQCNPIAISKVTDKDGNALTASDADGNAVECGVTDLGNGMESVTYGTVTEDPVNFSVADTLNTIVPKLVPLMLTLLLYYMFAKHSWTPTKGILLLFVLGILGAGPLGLWPSIW